MTPRCLPNECDHYTSWGDTKGGQGKGRCWKKSRRANPGEPPEDQDRVGVFNVTEGADCCLVPPNQQGLF